MQAGRERRLVTAAMLAGIFLAALEATAVATAMPTVVAELGGVSRYSWAFSAYLLTSTTTVPLFGRFADLHGRKRIYAASVGIFLLGSALCGAATSFDQLILFRAIQGLGAGGVMPVAITIIGDIFSLEERGRVQGLFSGVWGVASIVGPAAGGLVTDLLTWRWVFYLNLPFGLLSAALVLRFLRESSERHEHRLDLVGTAALTLGVGLLLAALQEGGADWGWLDARTIAAFAVGAAAVGLFLRQERRAREPILPLDLFRNRVIATASLGAVALGTLLFSITAFVPVFTQGVLGGSAADAGVTLMPMSLAWPVTSTLAGSLLLRVGYRPLAVTGGIVTLGGCGLLATLGADSARPDVMLAMAVLGAGLGLVSTPYLVAVQTAVPWRRRGAATSSQQFFRTIGGAIAIAVFGVVLNARMGGVRADAASILDPALRATLDAGRVQHVADALAGGLHLIYLTLVAVAAVALLVALRFPGGSAASLAHVERSRDGR